MARAVFRSAILAVTLTAGISGAPLAAQMFSDGYQFLKSVKDREGDEVTNALNETNSAIINTRDKVSGETAVHIVTQRRDALWIRFLTSRGANPNIADKDGVTPLMIAVNLGFFEGVEALLEAGAMVDVTNSTGETPLISAVHRREIPMIRLLLAKGANPDRSDNSGRSARNYAALQTAGSRILAEFEQADKDRKQVSTGPSYGPSR